MEKEIITLNFTLQFEANDVVCDQHDTLGEAIEAGFAKIIKSDIHIESSVRGICKIDKILDSAKEVILRALKED